MTVDEALQCVKGSNEGDWNGYYQVAYGSVSDVLAKEVERLRAENAEALRYATGLCRSWFPSVEPLSTLSGVISQLDNGVYGLRAELRDRLEKQREHADGGFAFENKLLEAELERYKSVFGDLDETAPGAK